MSSTQGTTERTREAAGAAQHEGTELAHSAAGAGKDVAQTATDQASAVASQAKDEAKDLARNARDEVNTQVEAQRHRLVDLLRTTGDELRTGHDEHSALTAELTRRTAEQARLFADYLDDHGPQEILADVRSFARRRPGAFLLLAGVAGVVAGRVFRGVAEGDSPSSSSDTPSSPEPATSGTPSASTFPEPLGDLNGTTFRDDDDGRHSESTTYRTGSFVDDSAVSADPLDAPFAEPVVPSHNVDPADIAVGTATPVQPVSDPAYTSEFTPGSGRESTLIDPPPVTPATTHTQPGTTPGYPPADTQAYRPPVTQGSDDDPHKDRP